VTTVDDRRKALSLGADFYAEKPVSGDWLLETLKSLARPRASMTALLIDDEDIARYLVRQSLGGLNANFLEADTGEKGVELAIDKRPDLIFLDLGLPGITGMEALEALKGDARTKDIPVIVVTSHILRAEELAFVQQRALSIVSKADLGGRQSGERFQSIIANSGISSIQAMFKSSSEG
jgi:CheY-like chemotaxis protein